MEDPEARFMKFREAVFEAWKERKSIAVFGEPGSSFGTNWRWHKSPTRASGINGCYTLHTAQLVL